MILESRKTLLNKSLLYFFLLINKQFKFYKKSYENLKITKSFIKIKSCKNSFQNYNTNIIFNLTAIN